MGKQGIVIIGLIIGLIIATFIGIKVIQQFKVESKTKDAEVAISLKVKVEHLKATEEPFEFSVFGIVKSIEEALVSSEVNGVILSKSNSAFAGISVKKDTVLFEIYHKDLDLQKEKLQRFLNKRQIELKELKLQIELNEKELISQKEILALSEKENNRMKSLSSSDHVSINLFEQAKILFLQTKIRTESLESAIQSHPLRKETIEESIKELNIQVQEIDERISKATIKAPFDGVIKEVFAEVGVTASPGVKLFSIYNSQVLEIPVNIGSTEKEALDSCVDVKQIKLKLNNGGIGLFHRFEGVVSSTTKMQTVVFRLIEEKKLLLGEMVSAKIIVPTKEKYYRIKKNLVIDSTILTVVNGKLKKIKISPRYELKDFFIIYEGLQDGDQLIETAINYAVENSAVTIYEDLK